MSMVEVSLPDGTIHEIASGVSVGDVIKDSFGKGAVAGIINGQQCDLSTLIEEPCELNQILSDSDEGLHVLRHSCAHLLAQAVTELYPGAKPTIGPPIEHGFYYDFEMDPLSEEDLRAIEKKMKYFVKQNLQISREEYDGVTLRQMFAENKFKIEIIDEQL